MASKRVSFILFVFLGTGGLLAAPAGAQEKDWNAHMSGSMRKLGRGVANVATCPLELIRTPSLVGRSEGLIAEITTGIAKGAWNTVVRGVAGVYEVITFPIETKEGFEPIVKPEYVWANSNWAE